MHLKTVEMATDDRENFEMERQAAIHRANQSGRTWMVVRRTQPTTFFPNRYWLSPGETVFADPTAQEIVYTARPIEEHDT